MFKRGPALLQPFRETCITFQRGRGVPLRCYSASIPYGYPTHWFQRRRHAAGVYHISSHNPHLAGRGRSNGRRFPPAQTIKTNTRRKMHSKQQNTHKKEHALWRGDGRPCPFPPYSRATPARPMAGHLMSGGQTRRRSLGRKLVTTPAHRKS